MPVNERRPLHTRTVMTFDATADETEPRREAQTHAATTKRTTSITFIVGVEIDPAKAGWLYNWSASATAFNMVDRLEIHAGNCSSRPTIATWDGGTLMWCDGALDAIVLAAYEEHHGHRTMLLWDHAGYAMDGGGPARPHDRL